MKLLIVAGGGGHFAPALAVIQALPKDVEVMVVGRKYAFEGDEALAFEYQTSHKLGIPFIPLRTGRLQRKLTRHSIISLAKIPGGYLQAVKILKQFKPDVVLSFGGYVSFPVCLAAKTLGIPLVIHEQILGAGLTNKIVARFANKVCVSWKESANFFPSNKVIITGNPIRKPSVIASGATRLPTLGTGGQEQSQSSEITAILSVARNDDKKLVYITGGSGGAHGINLLVEECLEQLLERYIVVHQTGDAKEYSDFDRLEKKKDSLPKELQRRYILTKFVESEEVLDLMKKSDLLVSRSGINTVTELLSLGKPCLLIPLPHGQHNEQLTNAMFVKQIGIAEVAEQQNLTGDSLYALITKMVDNLDRYKEHNQHAKDQITSGAAANIIEVVSNVNAKEKITRS